MRPINLIPEDQRRGPGASRKGGAIAYVLIGALVILLGGVALLVSTNNQISTSKGEITELEAENTAAAAKVSELAAYTKLEEVHNARVATVTSLADSRFDWERVLRELSLILPRDVWLSNLTGTVEPAVSVNGSAGITLRAGASGPALEIVGCASSQDAVAGFVSSLRDIDGVTRVALEYSKKPEGGSEVGGTTESDSNSGGGGSCQTQPFIPEFQIVAAFDAAPVPSAAEGEVPVTEAPAEVAEGAATTTEESE